MGFNHEVDVRLLHWSYWIISINEGEQGWPDESIIAKFSTEGFIPTDNFARSSSCPIYNPKAEKVNTFINQMRVDFPKYSDAIYHYYTSKKNVKQLSIERKISTRTFYDRVKSAKIWLQAKMGL